MTTPKDRVYRLKGKQVPLSYVLASRDTKRMRLLHYDEKTNKNRVLRYATNFNSPFMDEQEGEAVLEDIIFEKGFLYVPKTNPALQEFMKVHPGNGRIFEEVDHAKDAEAEIERIDLEEKAIIAARGLKIEQMEHVYRILFGKDPSNVASGVIIRDVKIYARNNAADFLSKIEDPSLTVQSDVRLMFDLSLVAFRNNKRDIHWNLRDNKKRMISIPMGADPYRELQAYFETEEGLETMKILKLAREEM